MAARAGAFPISRLSVLSPNRNRAHSVQPRRWYYDDRRRIGAAFPLQPLRMSPPSAVVLNREASPSAAATGRGILLVWVCPFFRA